MAVGKNSKLVILLAVAAFVAVGTAAGILIVQDDSENSLFSRVWSDEEDVDSTREAIGKPKPPVVAKATTSEEQFPEEEVESEAAESKFDDTYEGWYNYPEGGIEYLRTLAHKKVPSSHRLFSDLIDLNSPAKSSYVAFDVALEIASKHEAWPSEFTFLKRWFKARSPEMRLYALRATKDHPDMQLVEPLGAIVDTGGKEGGAALTALAFIDDRKARERIRDFLADETKPETDRLRAVSLLSITKDINAIPILQKLEYSDSEMLRIAAKSVLKSTFNLPAPDG